MCCHGRSQESLPGGVKQNIWKVHARQAMAKTIDCARPDMSWKVSDVRKVSNSDLKPEPEFTSSQLSKSF